MSRGYLGGRRQARKHAAWNRSDRKRRQESRKRQLQEGGGASSAEDTGAVLLLGSGVFVGIPLLLCLLIEAIRHPWLGGVLGALLIGGGWGLLWRKERRAQEQRLREEERVLEQRVLAKARSRAMQADPNHEAWACTDYGDEGPDRFHEEGLVDHGPVSSPVRRDLVWPMRPMPIDPVVEDAWAARCRAARARYEEDVRAGRARPWPLSEDEEGEDLA